VNEWDRASAPAHAPIARVRARRRPGLVLLVYAYRTVAAILLALPLSVAARGAIGPYPRGDAGLFDPGGVALLEALRLLEPTLAPLGLGAALGAVVVAFAGLLPLAMLLDAVGLEGRLPARLLLERAASRMGTLSLLFGAATVAQAFAGAAFIWIGQKSLARVAWSAAPHKHVSIALLWAAGLLLVGVLGVVHDLARAYAVRRDLRFYDATSCALRAVRRTGLRALWAYVWRASIGVAGIAAALSVSSYVGLTTGGRLVAVALVDQAALLLAATMRASWLAAAVRVAERVYVDESAELSRLATLEAAEQGAPPEAPASTEPTTPPADEHG
jgi:hypothetical protein